MHFMVLDLYEEFCQHYVIFKNESGEAHRQGSSVDTNTFPLGT